MKKIVYLIETLTSGGAETLVKDYSLHLNKKKFEVVIIVTENRQNTSNEEELKKNGIKVYFLSDYINFKKNNRLLIWSEKFLKYLVYNFIIWKEKPNIIHSHLWVNDYILMTRPTSKISYFHTLHSEVSKYFIENVNANFYRKTTELAIKIKKMQIIALHERMKRETDVFFNIDNTLIINNGINILKFKNEEVNNKILNELGCNEKDFIIGHVGRFVETKNHIFLLNVFQDVKKYKPNAKLLLIGTGILQESIKKMVNRKGLSSDVIFLGVRNDVPQLLKLMDVFLFPSIYEGFGNVLIEAQISGTKSIASHTVPIETKISNLVSYISLEDPVDKWTKEVLKVKPEKIKYYNIIQSDIRWIVKKLERLYLNTD